MTGPKAAAKSNKVKNMAAEVDTAEEFEDDSTPIPVNDHNHNGHNGNINTASNGSNGEEEGDNEVQDGPLQVMLPLEDFAEDLHLRLGRANGNVYHRRAGIEGKHDGQVMVRLKKKRFVVLDYGIVPNRSDLQASSMNPHMACPPGAGRRQCTVQGCSKVGVPVLLYDSEPDQTASLYLRGGLCFSCQRNLNEKRRTQRKKGAASGGSGGGGGNGNGAVADGGLVVPFPMMPMPLPHHQHQMNHPSYLFGSPSAAAMSGPTMAAAMAFHQQQQQQQQQYLQQPFTKKPRLGAPKPPPPATTASPYGHYATSLMAGPTTGPGSGGGGVMGAPHPPPSLAPPAAAPAGAAAAMGPTMTLQFPPPAPGTAPLKQASQGHGYADIGVDLTLASQRAFEDTDRLLDAVRRRHQRQQEQQSNRQQSQATTFDDYDMEEGYKAAFASVARSLFLLQQWKQAWDGAAAADRQLAAAGNHHVVNSSDTTNINTTNAAPNPSVLGGNSLGNAQNPAAAAAAAAGAHAPHQKEQQQQQNGANWNEAVAAAAALAANRMATNGTAPTAAAASVPSPATDSAASTSEKTTNNDSGKIGYQVGTVGRTTDV